MRHHAGLDVPLAETSVCVVDEDGRTARNYARGLAQMLRTGRFRRVHVKARGTTELRTLLTSRNTLALMIGDVENQVRGSLHLFGIKLGTAKRRTSGERVRELAVGLPRVAAVLDVLLQAHAAMLHSLDRLNRVVLEVAREHAVCRRLTTVPGVDAVVGLTYIAAIGEPARFAKSRSVGAVLRMVPRKHRSGEVDRNGRITGTGDTEARTAISEAARVMLHRVKKWSGLKAWAARVAELQGNKRTAVALAREMMPGPLVAMRSSTTVDPRSWDRSRPRLASGSSPSRQLSVKRMHCQTEFRMTAHGNRWPANAISGLDPDRETGFASAIVAGRLRAVRTDRVRPREAELHALLRAPRA